MINAVLQWFDETRLWKWFAKNIMAHFTFRIWGYPEFDFSRYDGLHDLIEREEKEPNYVYAFVLADRLSLASVVIRAVSKSRWSHAGFLVFDQRIGPVAVHMKGTGIMYEHVGNVLKACDEFAVVKLFVTDKKAVKEKLLRYAFNPKGVRYDFEQELDNDASPLERDDIYCSELVWVCAKDHAMLATSEVLGRRAFSPDDVAQSGPIVWEQTQTN